MNKKFSTLVAALLLSTSVGTFTAQAADPLINSNISAAYANPGDKGYENGKAYLLKAADGKYLSVKATDDTWELVMEEASASTSLPELYRMMWTVQVVDNAGSEPLYTFINKHTQTVLAIDPAVAAKNAVVMAATTPDETKLSFEMAGSITSLQHAESYKVPNDENPIYANIGGDKVAYLTVATNGKVYATVAAKSAGTTNALEVQPYKMGAVTLSANDLNTMLYAGLPDKEATASDYFDLTFDPNLASVFNESQLQAVAVQHKELLYGKDGSHGDSDYAINTDVNGSFASQYASLQPVDNYYKNTTAGYVALKNVKGEYLVVDTAYVPGTDNNNNGLLKFTTDGLYNTKNDTRYRCSLSYLFKFTLNVTDQTVSIASRGFVRRSADPFEGTGNGSISDLDAYYQQANNYGTLQAAKLGSHWYNRSELTADPNEGGMVYEGMTADYAKTRFVTHVLLNTEDIVTLGEITPASASTESNEIAISVGSPKIYTPTTMANGAYLLQDVKTGKYLVNNLVGTTELVDQAARQNFQHMPAAQWIVTSNGNATTVVNREFEEMYKSGILYKGDASDQGFFYNDNVFKFIPVENPTDKYLGYKWIKDEELNETRFTFNYLHDLAMDKPLNTINTKDSVVWVDKNDEAMSFSLEKVIDDEYGYNADLKNVTKLNRRVYRIKVNDANKLVNNDRYLSYSNALKKYVVATGYDNADYFLLKENNEVEGGDCYNVLLTPNTIYAGKFKPADASASIKEGHFVANTISSVGHYVMDNDIDGYYRATWGTVTNANGYAEEGWVPYVQWVPTVLASAADMVTTENAGKALGYKSGENGATWGTSWTKTIDHVEHTLCYVKLSLNNSAYAYSKVSVDNNTLALVNGVLSDGKVHEVANSAFAVKYAESQLYRRVDGMENVKVFRVNSTAKEYLYEDALSKYSAGKEFNFLGVEGKGDAKNAAMFLDTAYVNRETIMPQYMFVLRPEFVEADTIWCNATEGHKHATLADSLACEHTSTVAQSVKGWYLVNLADSVAAENARIADAEGGILSNKYLLDKTKYTRLGFVKATHTGDKLIIDNSIYTGDTRQITPGYATTYASKDTIDLSKNAHNKVAFSFRLVDDSDDFLIESQGDKKAPKSNGGWIKIQNGVPVIAQLASYHEAVTEAELFNLEATDEDPTANEAVEASEVSVVAVQGAIIVKGAAGKVVTVANILGQTIANQVAASDNVTIAAPAGVAVVTVDGEATKVVVK